MNIFKSLAYGLLVSSLLVFSGCEGNNSDAPANPSAPDTNTTLPPDGNTTLPPIDLNATTDAKYLVMIGGNTFVTTGNLQTKEINMLVFNSNGSTNTEGEITFQWPQEFIDGTLNDIGMISPSKATIVDGKVSFTYTSPYDLNNTETQVSGINFLFHSTTAADVNTTFHVDYNSSGNYSAADPVLQTLILSDSTLGISNSSETQNLLLYAFSDQSTAIVSADLQVKYPQDVLSNNIDIGLLNTPIHIQNGVDNLIYTGPGDVSKTISDLSAAGITQPISLEIYDPTTSTNVILSLTFSNSTSVKSYAGYSFSANPNSILITSSQQESGVILYLEDNSSRPAVGETVVLDYFDGTKGEVSTFSAVTDANGRAIFGYIAPIIADNNMTASFYDMNFTVEGASLTDIPAQIINLSIDTRAATEDFSTYALTALPATITIKDANESKAVDLYLEDNNSRPVVGETILLDYFNGSQGTMNSFSALTDANGHVTFNYTAPTTVADGALVTLTFRGQNTTLGTATTVISVDTTPPPPTDFSTYALTALPATITIKDANESKAVDLYLEDNNSRPVVGETILLDYFNGSQGTMNSFSALTDANGHVTFNYTAPTTVADGALVTLTFRGQNTTLGTATTVIDVNSSAPTDPKYNDYVLTVYPENNVTIVAGGQSDIIDVYLEDNITHLPVANELVLVKFFDGSNGNMSSFSKQTDSKGHIAFTYTAPDTIASLANHQLEFSLSESSTVSDSTTVIYDPSTPVIRLEDTSITLTTDGQTESVVVLAFNSETNQTFNSGTIVVEYPSEIVDGSRTGGLFSQSEASIVNGRAVFAFTGPNPLDANSSLDFTFSYKEDTSVSSAVLTVTYTPFVPDEVKVVLVGNTYTATLNSEAISISMNVFKNLRPVTEGEVRVRFPGDVLTGRDVGYFDSTAVVVSNGVATFSYFAPKNLKENNDSIEFIFYHEDNYTDDSAKFTVNIEPLENQIILTDYELRSNLKDGNITMNLESSKMLSFYVQEIDGTLLGDGNITSITVTLLNPTLGNLSDTNASANAEDNVTSNGKNNFSLRLDTITKSGILPIKVYTEFKGVNNEDRNITEIYNIVIFSGPPTAISISYASTGQEEDFAKFKENLVVTVTDKYFNYVNSAPGISVSLIAGYEIDIDDNRVYQAPNLDGIHSDSKGIMNTGSPTIFDANSSSSDNKPFINVGVNHALENYTLATFGQGYSYAASGGWNIASVTGSQLELSDFFDSNETQKNLGFAVGYNFRQDTCRPGSEWIGSISVDSLNGKLDASGIAKVNVNYDYYLTGKDVIVAVNIVGYTASTDRTSKIGEAKKITLRGLDFSSTTCNVPSGKTVQCTFLIKMPNTGESLRNANFGANIVTSDKVTYTNLDRPNVIGTCSKNGVAHITLDATENSGTAAGTVNLSDIIISNEF